MLIISRKKSERVGFEPTVPVKVRVLSRDVPSATQPSFLKGALGHYSV